MTDRVADIRQKFANLLSHGIFVTDRTGCKVIEILNASFIADEDSIFGLPNAKYIEDEIAWYMSKDPSIYALRSDPPEQWHKTADRDGLVNSNYGMLMFTDEFHNQYDNAVAELKRNPDSRRACMVYMRPSIWKDWNENGRSDFICTLGVTAFVREHKLHFVVSMRSNDVVFGYNNDLAWQRHLQQMMADELRIPVGDLHWNAHSLHVYERHFDLVRDWME